MNSGVAVCHFKNRPRVPPGWIAIMVALPIICVIAVPLMTTGPAAPNAGWWIVGIYLAIVLITGLSVIPQSWGAVEVDDKGLHVRGRLVVPVHRLGEVRLLSGYVAMLTSLYPHSENVRLRVRQNLYGGGFGWGKGVLVEDRQPGREPSLWLLPGPRAQELAEALELARANAQRRRQPGRR